jgi:hypothetical protein
VNIGQSGFVTDNWTAGCRNMNYLYEDWLYRFLHMECDLKFSVDCLSNKLLPGGE